MKKLIVKQHQIAETEYRYVVTQVINETTPKIGAKLSEADVQLFCHDSNWSVTIKGE